MSLCVPVPACTYPIVCVCLCVCVCVTRLAKIRIRSQVCSRNWWQKQKHFRQKENDDHIQYGQCT
ncbi:Uncharacterized protein APZ42_031227 [Daphnia magna]|uniref:Uncharacterized protein n=1 Tax=Daphnia magna TaxID=35525 RepID=A0A164N1L7_9CRUS|nr:Uncharacterized protein APZ42_031227 [Daphnia magna]